ncbi:hypothetical protein IMG5_099670 [Ichthyophthirius multifiliis]|uniref:Uncharacterized protein n=1 Tax=Ichthyophthirius multifiliis TaxID=5932 RepID=G0QS74_ICHMU|nr:hypothetical protein IMG5_099670 [Ichthyophthirius multifiliis]EGR31939.1 hypothetical protein IMG5_099670 [Ichthyophthirius multifiliis]|eukprot:XP_004035425.1 hypothetical protein IMG5_099670 [Ichthyophthirius multifiliis]
MLQQNYKSNMLIQEKIMIFGSFLDLLLDNQKVLSELVKLWLKLNFNKKFRLNMLKKLLEWFLYVLLRLLMKKKNFNLKSKKISLILLKNNFFLQNNQFQQIQEIQKNKIRKKQHKIIQFKMLFKVQKMNKYLRMNNKLKK